MANCAIKSDWKNATTVDTSQFAKKDELGNLKSDVDELDVHKLKATPGGLRKLINEVKNEVVKKTKCNELVKKS